MGALKNAGLERLWSYVCTKFNELSTKISSLTAADVGAMKTAHLGGSGDFNTVVDPGCYRFDDGWSNGPLDIFAYGQLLVVRGASDTIVQIAFRYDTNRAWMRTGWGYYGDYTAITWKSWANVLTAETDLVIGPQNYGDTPPENAVEGQVFFKRVT